MSDVLTAEEREVVEELRAMAIKGFYSVACDFDAKCVAIIDRLVSLAEAAKRTIDSDMYHRIPNDDIISTGTLPHPTDAEIEKIRLAVNVGAHLSTEAAATLLRAYDAVCRERDATVAGAAIWLRLAKRNERRWQWERRKHDWWGEQAYKTQALAKVLMVEVEKLRRERDEARAAGWHEALDAVNGMIPISEWTRFKAFCARYPRPAAKEAKRG